MKKHLTIKQKLFVNEFVKSKNGTNAAMKTYNVKSRNVAKTIASQNLTKLNIRDAIEHHLQAAGYDPQSSIAALIENQEVGKGVKATASESIRASELLLKLSGHMQDKSQRLNLNYNIDNMDRSKLYHLNAWYSTILKRRHRE